MNESEVCMPEPIKTFCCYAREDKHLLEKLNAHLTILRREKLIHMWDDRDITAGTEREKEIHDHLNTDQMILLLISPSFMGCNDCYAKMQHALERHRRGEARIIPIILRPVHWQQNSPDKLQSLPTDGRSVMDWDFEDKAFFDIVEGIRKVLPELQEKAAIASREENSSKGRVLLENPAAGNAEKKSQLVRGADDFLASLANLATPAKIFLQRGCEWAVSLEQERLVQLYTYHGKNGVLTLLPRLKADDAGFVSFYNNHGTVYMQFWRSVFERRAPRALATIEASMMPVKQGNTCYEASEELLAMLTEAYREAAR